MSMVQLVWFIGILIVLTVIMAFIAAHGGRKTHGH